MLDEALAAIPDTRYMKSLSFLIMPAFVGLLAGVAHGIITHRAGLPLDLTEQVHQVVAGKDVSLQ